MNEMTSSAPPVRGPADHTVREQIVEAAGEHFRHYGYEKTTVSDLAKAIGFSKAYIYKFFDSKQAIGEAICARTLRGIVATVEEAVADATTTQLPTGGGYCADAPPAVAATAIAAGMSDARRSLVSMVMPRTEIRRSVEGAGRGGNRVELLTLIAAAGDVLDRRIRLRADVDRYDGHRLDWPWFPCRLPSGRLLWWVTC